MAEIKSTLDLVMERTKHLSLSKEEKEEQRLSEIRGGFRGLVQKYQSQILTRERFEAELSQLQERHELKDNGPFVDEIVNRIDLEQDNGFYLALLNEIFRIDAEGIRSLLDDYRDSVEKETAERAGLIKEELQANHAISGSAVSPNLEGDNLLQTRIQDIKERSEVLLTKEKQERSSPGPA